MANYFWGACAGNWEIALNDLLRALDRNWHSSTAALDELAWGADVIASSMFAFAADIIAEKYPLPLATMV